MATRAYQFIVGPETSTLPTVGTVGASTDLTPASYCGEFTGTRASPSLITAAGGIAFSGTFAENTWFIAGSGGPIDITVNPQITAGINLGQRLRLIGRHATNSVKFDDGTGLSLNGSAILAENEVLSLMWDGTSWLEISRSY